MKKIILLMVNTGKLYSVEKSIITDPLIHVRKLTKSLVKHRFSLHNLLKKQKSENM